MKNDMNSIVYGLFLEHQFWHQQISRHIIKTKTGSTTQNDDYSYNVTNGNGNSKLFRGVHSQFAEINKKN